ncbi:MAG: heme-binding domain-containing protein [Saprospiraceae bacterium]
MIRKILLALLAILIVIQFFKPAKNISNDNTNHITKQYPMTPEVSELFAVACNDCHTNSTRYPWYNNFQPVAWFLNDHVVEGKRHLNLSELGSKRIALQYKKLKEIVDMVEKGEMPFDSYTWIHSDARLTDVQKNWITTWAKSASDQMKAIYPADSLVLPKRK